MTSTLDKGRKDLRRKTDNIYIIGCGSLHDSMKSVLFHLFHRVLTKSKQNVFPGNINQPLEQMKNLVPFFFPGTHSMIPRKVTSGKSISYAHLNFYF